MFVSYSGITGDEYGDESGMVSFICIYFPFRNVWFFCCKLQYEIADFFHHDLTVLIRIYTCAK